MPPIYVVTLNNDPKLPIEFAGLGPIAWPADCHFAKPNSFNDAIEPCTDFQDALNYFTQVQYYLPKTRKAGSINASDSSDSGSPPASPMRLRLLRLRVISQLDEASRDPLIHATGFDIGAIDGSYSLIADEFLTWRRFPRAELNDHALFSSVRDAHDHRRKRRQHSDSEQLEWTEDYPIVAITVLKSVDL